MKKSIFGELPYWSTILIRHNLDMMHIEPNDFDNIFSTMMDVSRKTKDNIKAQQNLKVNMFIKVEHSEKDDDNERVKEKDKETEEDAQKDDDKESDDLEDENNENEFACSDDD
ncbi:probable ATP-dependent RNA helicase ddx56 [Herrania umbratica]|uniref:Probable ATP-dependent RNA helicase ddx56 n=1 Tax=Herrania umbratica TaxID=108875 RepID=A0A6J0ZXY7_9ROSI|nr:probable ATP-dependent RNA helicase ddx56 [Herrania umbratica]